MTLIRAGRRFARLRAMERPIMQSSNWAPEHCQALREYRARGMSYGQIAQALNAKFGTTYTRNAALGRGVRMGLPSSGQPVRREKRFPEIRRPKRPRTTITEPLPRRAAESAEAAPAVKPVKPVTLRCVGITPRLIPLIELTAGDCRYPYGGDTDGEPITFCGHPKLPGSSYCGPHFHLTRGDEMLPERAAGPVVLRLVQAA
jgi:GcrA cell cycle regulator